MAIASSSLSLASGLAGLTAFAVWVLATAGSTLAVVVGPIGAVIAAVLGVSAIIVEIIVSLNPYTKIDQDINTIKKLSEESKKLLDANMENLQNLVTGRQKNFQFSWVYEVKESLMLEYIQGRAAENKIPVTFRLEIPPVEEDGYMTIGENKVFDKDKYPNNFFWNPSGLEDIGYDFYGKRATEELSGVTVLVCTDLIAGKPNVQLKGADIKTFNEKLP